MSQLNLGSPIQASLNFQPGGDPYSALASGGVAGLGAAYQQSYNSALSLNQQNYNNIISGYGTLGTNIANTLGQGGTGWGVAQPAATAIAQTQAQQTGGAFQNSINSGTGNSTAATAAQRGANLNAQQAYAGLGSQLASSYAGYEANLGQSQLNFMNSVNVPYPDAQSYSNLYQQYGQQAATQQQFALQQQAQQQLLRSSGGRPSGGGVSTPQMPGISSAGRGGFPSGSASTPTPNYGSNNFNTGPNGGTGYGILNGGLGGQTQGYQPPWVGTNPYLDPMTDGGDVYGPSDIGGDGGGFIDESSY